MRGGSPDAVQRDPVPRSRAGCSSILVLAAFAAACSAGAASAPGGQGGAGNPGTGGAAGPVTGGGTTGGNGNGNGNSNSNGDGTGNGQGNGNGGGIGTAGQIDQEGLLIVKNGALAIQVGGLETAIDAATGQVAALGGYASASNRAGDDDSAQATVTFRIPVARWEEALSALRGLGEKVLDERYATEEVTAAVVDLGARIANLRTTEAAFQAIMDRAVDIEDVLRVQSELTKVRSEIEQLTAQKTSLEGRAAFSTLAVTFATKPDPILAEQQGFDPANEVEQASASLVAVLQGVATAGIWFGIAWLPILVTLGVLGLIGLAIGRRVVRRMAGPGDAPLPSAGTGA